MPKYENLSTDALSSPPPPATHFDPAATVSSADHAHTAPAMVDDTAAKALPPRPVSSHTLYEEAYGGV
jgi:hypothetical protein